MAAPPPPPVMATFCCTNWALARGATLRADLHFVLLSLCDDVWSRNRRRWVGISSPFSLSLSLSLSDQEEATAGVRRPLVTFQMKCGSSPTSTCPLNISCRSRYLSFTSAASSFMCLLLLSLSRSPPSSVTLLLKEPRRHYSACPLKFHPLSY